VFFFLPIGLDEQTVNRIPWVTIGIAAACLLAFFGTYVLPKPTDTSEQARQLAEYWLQHPQVEPPEALTSVLSDGFLRRIASARRDQPGVTATPEEQATFDSLAAAFMAAVDHQPIRKYGLIPSRGFAQVGWLTYMFLHAGWMHILGNFLFFYLVGPILEDVWGRLVYLSFYLIGGLAAALAQFLAERHSGIAIVGASGAIAACMGAFMLRFASRRVRMFYFIWVVRPFTGTFLMRAWLWALLWVGSEIFSFLVQGAHGSGVAVLAHIGGFGFGAAFALGLKATGIERKHLAPAVEKTHEAWVQHPGIERAGGLLAEGDRAGAHAAFAEVLREQPHNRDAAVALARLELEAGHLQAGSRFLERALSADITRNDNDLIRATVEDLGTAFSPAALKPGIAYRVAQALEEGGNPGLAERTFAASGAAGGGLGAKALLRAAELRIASHTDVKGAAQYLDSLAAIPGVAPEVLAKAQELRRSVESSGVPGGGRGISLEDGPAASPDRPVVRSARLVAMEPTALQIEDETQRRMAMPMRNVLAVAVGVIPSPDGGGRNLVLTDVVLQWGGVGQRASVVRFSGGALSLPKLFPGVAPRDAFGQFLARLFEASGASGIPDKDAMLKGEYARYDSIAAFEAACYGLGTS
jgi:membrane associated rhomboid family serine protease